MEQVSQGMKTIFQPATLDSRNRSSRRKEALSISDFGF